MIKPSTKSGVFCLIVGMGAATKNQLLFSMRRQGQREAGNPLVTAAVPNPPGHRLALICSTPEPVLGAQMCEAPSTQAQDVGSMWNQALLVVEKPLSTEPVLGAQKVGTTELQDCDHIETITMKTVTHNYLVKTSVKKYEALRNHAIWRRVLLMSLLWLWWAEQWHVESIVIFPYSQILKTYSICSYDASSIPSFSVWLQSSTEIAASTWGMFYIHLTSLVHVPKNLVLVQLWSLTSLCHIVFSKISAIQISVYINVCMFNGAAWINFCWILNPWIFCWNLSSWIFLYALLHIVLT